MALSQMIRVRANRADLSEPREPQSLARHGYQRSVLANAEVVPHFTRASCERTWLRQLGQSQHFRNIGLAERMEHRRSDLHRLGTVLVEHLQQGHGSHDLPVGRWLRI